MILHHGIFFLLLRTIFEYIKVVPLTTLTVLRICHRHARLDLITYPIPCNGYNSSLVFPHFLTVFNKNALFFRIA